jgi:CMP-N,N'-diacetyllegionaminic acid synthase
MIIALVPARAGSKGVAGKNVADLGGFPLIAYSVRAGVLASSVDRVVVTTDSREVADMAVRYGAEAPFLRPPELARDDSLDVDYIRHALDSLGEAVEMVIQLRPTTPLRDPARIDEAVELFRSRRDASGLRSVHQIPEPPQKMFGIEDGFLQGLFPHETRPDYFNLPRQAFPPAYQPNGYVDIVLADTLGREGGLYGSRMLAFVTSPVVEVDGPEELELLRYQVQRADHPLLRDLQESMAGG